MTAEDHRYWTLFSSTFKLSACTFGGGFVIVPLMRKRFVEQLAWIEEQEMLDFVAIAQSSPGPIAVNAAILVGYRVAGFRGALVTVLGTLLPPLLIISILSFFYAQFRDHPIVNLFMKAMPAGVAAVICDVVITMTMGVVKQRRWLPLLIIPLAFIAVRFIGLNILWVLLACGVIGAVDTLLRGRKSKEVAR